MGWEGKPHVGPWVPARQEKPRKDQRAGGRPPGKEPDCRVGFGIGAWQPPKMTTENKQ